jgi:hypothetical protein
MERRSHTTGAQFIKQSRMFIWNVNLENCRNRNIQDKALEEMVKELNIPDLTPDVVKLKIKSIRSRYSSELAKVLNFEKEWCWLRRYLCTEVILVQTR